MAKPLLLSAFLLAVLYLVWPQRNVTVITCNEVAMGHVIPGLLLIIRKVTGVDEPTEALLRRLHYSPGWKVGFPREVKCPVLFHRASFTDTTLQAGCWLHNRFSQSYILVKGRQFIIEHIQIGPLW